MEGLSKVFKTELVIVWRKRFDAATSRFAM
jgi:hypothetical protein